MNKNHPWLDNWPEEPEGWRDEDSLKGCRNSCLLILIFWLIVGGGAYLWLTN